MWKFGGTKIERTQARYIFLPSGHINLRKIDFWGKTLRTREFSTGKYFGAATQESLRIKEKNREARKAMRQKGKGKASLGGA